MTATELEHLLEYGESRGMRDTLLTTGEFGEYEWLTDRRDITDVALVEAEQRYKQYQFTVRIETANTDPDPQRSATDDPLRELYTAGAISTDALADQPVLEDKLYKHAVKSGNYEMAYWKEVAGATVGGAAGVAATQSPDGGLPGVMAGLAVAQLADRHETDAEADE